MAIKIFNVGLKSVRMTENRNNEGFRIYGDYYVQYPDRVNILGPDTVAIQPSDSGSILDNVGLQSGVYYDEKLEGDFQGSFQLRA